MFIFQIVPKKVLGCSSCEAASYSRGNIDLQLHKDIESTREESSLSSTRLFFTVRFGAQPNLSNTSKAILGELYIQNFPFF